VSLLVVGSIPTGLPTSHAAYSHDDPSDYCGSRCRGLRRRPRTPPRSGVPSVVRQVNGTQLPTEVLTWNVRLQDAPPVQARLMPPREQTTPSASESLKACWTTWLEPRGQRIG